MAIWFGSWGGAVCLWFQAMTHDALSRSSALNGPCAGQDVGGYHPLACECLCLCLLPHKQRFTIASAATVCFAATCGSPVDSDGVHVAMVRYGL